MQYINSSVLTGRVIPAQPQIGWNAGDTVQLSQGERRAGYQYLLTCRCNE